MQRAGIDLSQLKQLDVDTQRKVARAGAGLTLWRDRPRPGGRTGSPFLPALAAARGSPEPRWAADFGWLMGHFGLAVDNVLAVELAGHGGDDPAACSTLRTTQTCSGHCAGAGATSVSSSLSNTALTALPNVYAGMLAYPASRAAEVLRLYRAIAAAAPDELTVMCILTTFPLTGLRRCFPSVTAGAPAGAERTVAPLYVLGEPSFSFAQTMPYSALLAINDPVAPDGRRYFDTTFSLSDLSDGAIAAIVANAAAATSPFSGIIFQHVHGAAVRWRLPPPPTLSAIPFHFAVVNSAAWEAGDGAEHIAWAKSAAASMQPFAARGAYVNFLGDERRTGSARRLRAKLHVPGRRQARVRPRQPLPPQPEHCAGFVVKDYDHDGRRGIVQRNNDRLYDDATAGPYALTDCVRVSPALAHSRTVN
ncbi:MAG: hypothetical protein U0X20_11325 [Caldilineaceae bacterium]